MEVGARWETLGVATEKNEKIAKVRSSVWRFRHENLVKTKSFRKVCEKNRAELLISIKHFKISQLQEELPKVQLKS